MKNKQWKKIYLIALITFGIGLLIGIFLGVAYTLHEVVEIASGFIEIDYKMLNDAIFRYKNHIKGDYPNAYLFNDSRN